MKYRIHVRDYTPPRPFEWQTMGMYDIERATAIAQSYRAVMCVDVWLVPV